MAPTANGPGGRASPGATLLACVAVALPTLIAYNVPPSATFFNQDCALVGWGLFGLLLALALPADAVPRARGFLALAAALGLTLLAALASPLWASLPWSLGLSAAGTIAAAGFVAALGASLAEHDLQVPAFRALCLALFVAGLGSAAVGLVQVYAPGAADGDWIARSALEGRATGNVRQPNHLSSVLLWSLVAAAWLREARVLKPWLALGASALFVFVIVLSSSRTGAIGTVTLAAWGLLDRRLARSTRFALMLVPVAYIALWLGAYASSSLTGHAFAGAARLEIHGRDYSSSRFGIWANTLQIIRTHPWFGTGFGEFNFAWTLTPFPTRPVAFFDHTHNLPLQLIVELGIPLGTVALALLAWALVEAVRRAIAAGRAAEASPCAERGALVMVAMMIVHSMLEYPLWYSYFLLPTAFAFGLCLARPASGMSSASPVAPDAGRTRPFVLASMALVLVAIVTLWDYARVVVIFAPPEGASSLEQRIEEGRHSWFFAPHADYAAATTPEHPATAMPSFSVATHYLLDARLMMAWARALAESGDEQRARYVAQRLREFRNDAAQAFFAPCTEPATAPEALPFQCKAPTRTFGYEDFR